MDCSLHHLLDERSWEYDLWGFVEKILEFSGVCVVLADEIEPWYSRLCEGNTHL
jgi:hypothetical protein